MEGFIYEGRRIVLREILPSDASLYFSWLGAGHLEAYRPGIKRFLSTLQETRNFLSWRKRLVPLSEIEFWVYRRSSLSPAGVIGILGIDEYHRKGELVAIFQGLGLRERFEAFMILLCGGFNLLRLEKLFFLIREEDTRFLNFLARIGLQPEAYLPREGRAPDGKRYGVYRFALFPEVLYSPLFERMIRLAGEKPPLCGS